MAARIDTGDTADDDSVFPVRYQKIKSERGYKATRIASLDSSQIVRGQLCERTVLVHTKACSEVPRNNKGDCYGRGVLEQYSSRIVEHVGTSNDTNGLQGSLIVEAEETDGIFDVAELKEQVQCLKSCIHLCLEEAFYLVHCKQTLKVYMDDTDTVLTVEELWRHCCKMVKNFVHKYVVYHCYRSKGWVPKPGMKFGVHFLLYKDGPPYYHSSYGVVVRSMMSASELTWQFVISLVRTMDSVNKGAIICEVKSNQKETDLSTPSCISTFIVEETLVCRWVPKQDRN